VAFDEALTERIREVLADEPGLTGKKMFGGYGFLLDGNMCAGVSGDNLIARVPADDYPALLEEPNVTAFPESGRAMRGWVAVEPDGIAEDEDLARWVQSGVSVARSLPPK
jgi:TfoX/Sxy family transcriptional regulator of competence genes